MSFLASNQQWLCFINGLETPIIAASTTCQMGGLATTQITLPYSPFLSKLPKNVKITLFSLDLANPRNQTPKLEFDGVVQNISWRKDKSGANTALFLMAHTDGVIWSARKKFAYFLDNAFSIPQMQSVAHYQTTNLYKFVFISINFTDKKIVCKSDFRSGFNL